MQISQSTRLKSAFLWGGLGTLAVAMALLAAVFRSTSSTAAIAIIFIPFQAAPFAVPFFIFGYCLPDLLKWNRFNSARLSKSTKLRGVIAASLGIYGIAYITSGIILTNVVDSVRTMNETRIDKFLESSLFRSNKFALGALAQNESASAAALDKIARLQRPELHDKMWTVWPVMAGNGKGLAVMRLVVGNPNVSEETIEYLARMSQNELLFGDTVENLERINQNGLLLGDIAANPKTSIETLRRLEAKKNSSIDWGLSRNPKSPPDVFIKLLNREKYFTQEVTLKHLLENPSTPSEVKTKASVLLDEYK